MKRISDAVLLVLGLLHYYTSTCYYIQRRIDISSPNY